MLKGNGKFEPPRFMTCAQAATLLLRMEEEFKEDVCGPEVIFIEQFLLFIYLFFLSSFRLNVLVCLEWDMRRSSFRAERCWS
jgi:hypothetical protein